MQNTGSTTPVFCRSAVMPFPFLSNASEGTPDILYADKIK